ncbi:hypothetical protein ACQRIT_006559 [Beauveria bassiana]
MIFINRNHAHHTASHLRVRRRYHGRVSRVRVSNSGCESALDVGGALDRAVGQLTLSARHHIGNDALGARYCDAIAQDIRQPIAAVAGGHIGGEHVSERKPVAGEAEARRRQLRNGRVVGSR